MESAILMKNSPRLLYLGHNLPYPPHEGALIRSYHTVRLLSRSFDVTGLYFFRRDASATEEARREALDHMQRFGSAHAFPIPQEWSGVRFALDHSRSLLSGSPYIRWVYESRDVRTLVGSLLRGKRFDLVHVDSLDLLAYLPMLRDHQVILAHHNVESALLRRRATAEHGIRRSYIRLQARLLERSERIWCPRVALNVAVSPEDLSLFQRIAPGARWLVIPNGVDTRSMTPAKGEPEAGIVFVGGYSWFPNADGMDFFAREVLPLVRKEEPGVPVRWIGRAPHEAIDRFRHFGVEMLGYLPDIRPEVNRAACFIVPLLVGGGTRLKILDAWAMGKAVVSTSLGCEGLQVKQGNNILIADGPRDFASSILAVLRDSQLRRTLESGGRATAEACYDWELLGQKMSSHYRSLLESSV